MVVVDSHDIVAFGVDLKNLPLIHSYDSIQALNRKLEKRDRAHDLVISVSALHDWDSLFISDLSFFSKFSSICKVFISL